MATTNQMVGSEKVRIRLKAYDHVILDQSAEKIVDTAKKTGAKVSADDRDAGGAADLPPGPALYHQHACNRFL